ncbi:fructose PTS transporter subunit IIB [Necropsobacter massiliensis]|uniref:fructose PTS transporter subunit IIB n=1 Tax=Necropsobacter massiliensis TaxID=1400001 RepID=UPI000AFBBD72|nr:fructose PTS transporter subunit IIB [Necropsobacter massiliensis]
MLTTNDKQLNRTMIKLNICAVTACISGVAHTYMAATQLEKIAPLKNWHIKVETQGALGIENELQPDDIVKSDIVLLICNTAIKMSERFEKCRCIEMDISQFLLNNDKLFQAVQKIMLRPKGTKIQLD